MNTAYIRPIMNDECNEDDYNVDISWDVVHKKGLGSSKDLRQEG